MVVAAQKVSFTPSLISSRCILYLLNTLRLSFAPARFLHIFVCLHFSFTSFLHMDCFPLCLPPSLPSHITFSTHLLILSSSNQCPHIHFLSAASLSCSPPPTISPAAGKLEAAQKSQVIQMVNSVSCRCLSCSHRPLPPPAQLLPDPQAICLAAAFLASDPIIQLVSPDNHTLILINLTPAYCKLCLILL